MTPNQHSTNCQYIYIYIAYRKPNGDRSYPVTDYSRGRHHTHTPPLPPRLAAMATSSASWPEPRSHSNSGCSSTTPVLEGDSTSPQPGEAGREAESEAARGAGRVEVRGEGIGAARRAAGNGAENEADSSVAGKGEGSGAGGNTGRRAARAGGSEPGGGAENDAEREAAGKGTSRDTETGAARGAATNGAARREESKVASEPGREASRGAASRVGNGPGSGAVSGAVGGAVSGATREAAGGAGTGAASGAATGAASAAAESGPERGAAATGGATRGAAKGGLVDTGDPLVGRRGRRRRGAKLDDNGEERSVQSSQSLHGSRLFGWRWRRGAGQGGVVGTAFGTAAAVGLLGLLHCGVGEFNWFEVLGCCFRGRGAPQTTH